MGDRHNIGLVAYDFGSARPKEIIWLYAHSGFYTDKVEGFAASLAHALDEARSRWDDHSYFNRIVIATLGDSVRGINIGTATSDEHKRYVVDSEKQEVYLMDNKHWLGDILNYPEPIITFSFDRFVQKYSKHRELTAAGRL